MGLRVWSRGEIFSKKINKKWRAHKAPPPITTKVNKDILKAVMWIQIYLDSWILIRIQRYKLRQKQKLTNNIFGVFFLVGIYIFKSEPSRYTLITKGLEINLVIFWPGSRSNFVDLDSKKELTKTISHSVISNRVGNSDTRFSIRTLKWAGSFFKPQQKF